MNVEKDKLIEFVSEDVALFLATKDNPEELTEEEMVAWRSGYISGYNRANEIQLNNDSE